MIDTDKYKGHNRGNWSWGNKGSTDNGDGTIMIRPFTQLESKSGVTLLAIHHGDANQSDLNLIKDAPLILEAYKRLVLVADELYLHIVGEPHMTLDELVAEMPWRNEE